MGPGRCDHFSVGPIRCETVRLHNSSMMGFALLSYEARPAGPYSIAAAFKRVTPEPRDATRQRLRCGPVHEAEAPGACTPDFHGLESEVLPSGSHFAERGFGPRRAVASGCVFYDSLQPTREREKRPRSMYLNVRLR
jgi:hypothetical protein